MWEAFSVPELPSQCDVAVIGAGPVGLISLICSARPASTSLSSNATMIWSDCRGPSLMTRRRYGCSRRSASLMPSRAASFRTRKWFISMPAAAAHGHEPAQKPVRSFANRDFLSAAFRKSAARRLGAVRVGTGAVRPHRDSVGARSRWRRRSDRDAARAAETAR